MSRRRSVGRAPEEEPTGAVGPLDHELKERVVEVGDQPAAVLEAAFVVLVGPAGGIAVTVQKLREAVVAAPPTAATQPERSILPGGRVQTRHPDGRVVIYEAQCGFTTIFPDGTVSTVSCNQVQPASLPALPPDAALRSFLDAHRDHLLQHIRQLVDPSPIGS